MTYLWLSLVWSVLGFIVGYVVGRMAREVHEIKQSTEGREREDG